MTTPNERVKEMLAQLSAAYNHPEIKKNPKVRNMIFGAAKELQQKNDPALTETHINKQLAISYMDNPKKFPDAALKLFQQLETPDSDYRTDSSATKIIPNRPVELEEE